MQNATLFIYFDYFFFLLAHSIFCLVDDIFTAFEVEGRSNSWILVRARRLSYNFVTGFSQSALAASAARCRRFIYWIWIAFRPNRFMKSSMGEGRGAAGGWRGGWGWGWTREGQREERLLFETTRSTTVESKVSFTDSVAWRLHCLFWLH